MIAEAASISQHDVEQLTALHRRTLPRSVLGRMGPSTLERYYRWVVRSMSEQLFVSREGTRVIGAAVLSLEPESVMRRFIAAAPAAFVLSASAAFLRDGAFRAQALAYVFERGKTTAAAVPEVLQIFVAPDRQSRHAGTALLEQVETWLKTHGVARYSVRTLAERNDATVAFYARRGFQPAGEAMFCGTRYHVLEKIVA